MTHDGTWIPRCRTILLYDYVLDANRMKLETPVPHAGSDERIKMPVISEGVGQSLGEIRSLSRFLRVMYDACAVQRNLYHECKVLHRNISDHNIMVAPPGRGFKTRSDGSYYGSVHYINQMLASDRNVKPELACLVIDSDSCADVEQLQTLEEQSGTSKCIARSIALGKPFETDVFPSTLRSMPTLEGRPLELYKSTDEAGYMKYTDAVQIRNSLPIACQAEHRHQLFHDAESTFWVIAWTLACAAPKHYEEENKWPAALNRFVLA
ncbi:hypothetical protein FS749_004153 [Ceratobasidium sp. UAMH 11750]|nr:hypothetical protein FS749_004153 [Ceratobasidium sp. UAMH 11750]